MGVEGGRLLTPRSHGYKSIAVSYASKLVSYQHDYSEVLYERGPGPAETTMPCLGGLSTPPVLAVSRLWERLAWEPLAEEERKVTGA